MKHKSKPVPKAAPKFKLGQVVMTPGAAELMTRFTLKTGESPLVFLYRHLRGDWGDVCPHDKQLNDWAVRDNSRILSSYNTPVGKLWIITEADRSATTLLLPDEY
jgi:hypothetical protein